MPISPKATELEWLRWFAQNADFGPADGDVKEIMQQQFMKETKKNMPEGWDFDGNGDKVPDKDLGYVELPPEPSDQPPDQELFRKMVSQRALRLARLIELDAPSVIIGIELVLVLKAGFLVAPSAVGSALVEQLLYPMRNGADFCATEGCENKISITDTHEAVFCETCESAEHTALEEAAEAQRKHDEKTRP